MAAIVLGQSPPSSTYNENGDGLPFYQGKLEFGDMYPTPRKWCTAPKKTAEKGDVLISVRAPVGPTNVCPEKSCIGRGLVAIRGLGGVETLFILYLMRAFERDLTEKRTGTTFDAITGDVLKEFVIPLPPFPEQHRIVAKIEELFTKLDAGVEALKKVKAQIKRYRQAVLKYAFEGKLTEKWRVEMASPVSEMTSFRKMSSLIPPSPTPVEPASVLLERIREERKKDAKGKYKELLPPDTLDLPELPEGWVWTRLEEIRQKR
jgi:Restriction endonuclease S subunits